MEEPQIKDPKTFLAAPIIVSPRMPKTINFHNDTQREAFFKEVALKSFRLARDFVRKQTGRELLPPPTYQGARFKSEEDIQRIQGAKDAEENKRKASEDAKKQRYLAKFAKQAQMEARLRKDKEKRDDLKKLSDIKNTKDSRKKAQKLSALIDGNESDDFDVGIEDENAEESKPQKRRPKESTKKVSAKRASRNEKYGFGGKKRGIKRNTDDSLNDDSSFSVRKNKTPFAGGVKKSKAPKNRPGKQRRQQMRNKKASRKQK